MSDCPLCRGEDERVLWRDDALRVIDAGDQDYPGFTRVIWQTHVREMSDLSSAERSRLMDAVWIVEAVQRKSLAPHKINLASLGNQVPHLHWHIIPRWQDDWHFPNPVWAVHPAGKNTTCARDRAQRIEARLGNYHAALIDALQQALR